MEIVHINDLLSTLSYVDVSFSFQIFPVLLGFIFLIYLFTTYVFIYFTLSFIFFKFSVQYYFDLNIFPTLTLARSSPNLSTHQLHAVLSLYKTGVWFVFADYIWVWGLAWSLLDPMFYKRNLKKTYFSLLRLITWLCLEAYE